MLSRVLGLVRDVVIAHNFGASNEYDAYTLAFTIPDQLFYLISGGALSAAFIPIFTQLYQSGEEERAWKMAAGVFGTVSVLVVLLVAICWIFAPQIVYHGIASRSNNPETRALAVDLMRILLLSPLMLTLAGVATGILQSFDRFTRPAFAPIAYNVGIILGAVLLSPFIGIRGVAVGVVVGAFGFLLLQLPAARQMGLALPRSVPWSNRDVRRMFGLLFPRIVGQSATQLSAVVAFALAAGLGDGRAGAYRYALTLFVLPVGLFGTSLASVTFPAMSREAAEKDCAGLLYLVRRSLRGVLFFVVPAGIGLIVLRYPIINLIYERGAFNARATALVAEPLLYFSIGMWAFALVDVLPRAFYALQDTRTPLKFALAAVALDILLSLLLIPVMGLGGLALAFSISTALQVVLLGRALGKRLGPILNDETKDYLTNLAIASSTMVFALYLTLPLLRGFESFSFLELVVRVGTVIGSAAGVYLLCSLVLRQEEIGVLLRLARRRG